jgi:menaquinone-9 beta-reductase
MSAVDLLDGLGVSPGLNAFQRTRGVRLSARDIGCRDFAFPASDTLTPAFGVVAPRFELDLLLSRRAVQMGASFLEESAVVDLRFESEHVSGLRVRSGGSEQDVSARFVVAADGGTSSVARKAGLFTPDRCATGFAMRGYYLLQEPVADLFQVHIPLTGPMVERGVAGYGWVFPVCDTVVNIGVGFFPVRPSDQRLNLRMLFDVFLRRLQDSDSSFAALERVGDLKGGPLPGGMDPLRCHGRGVVLVGDAAGLVDPFTGEGISGALESGKLAASVLDDALTKSNGFPPDLRAYSDLLEHDFRERFRVGTHVLKTYSFMWKVLEKTFDVDNRLFNALRKATIDYGSDTEHRILPGLLRHHRLLNDLDLLDEFREIITFLEQVLGVENPLISKIARRLIDRDASFVRLALFLLCRRIFSVEAIQPSAISAAAATELSNLAFEVQADVIDYSTTERSASKTGINWANMFTLTAGNFLLVTSYRIFADLEPEVNRAVSQTCINLCSGRLQQIRLTAGGSMSTSEYLRLAEMAPGAVFDLSCTLGAMFGGADARRVSCLGRAGRLIGAAYRLRQESYWVGLDVSEPQSHPLAVSLRRGCPTYPLLWAAERTKDPCILRMLQEQAGECEDVQRCVEILRNGGSVPETLAQAEALRRRAEEITRTLPAVPAREQLLELIATEMVDMEEAHRAVAPNGTLPGVRMPATCSRCD